LVDSTTTAVDAECGGDVSGSEEEVYDEIDPDPLPVVDENKVVFKAPYLSSSRLRS
jgi:hypothetical protein